MVRSLIHQREFVYPFHLKAVSHSSPRQSDFVPLGEFVQFGWPCNIMVSSIPKSMIRGAKDFSVTDGNAGYHVSQMLMYPFQRKDPHVFRIAEGTQGPAAAFTGHALLTTRNPPVGIINPIWLDLKAMVLGGKPFDCFDDAVEYEHLSQTSLRTMAPRDGTLGSPFLWSNKRKGKAPNLDKKTAVYCVYDIFGLCLELVSFRQHKEEMLWVNSPYHLSQHEDNRLLRNSSYRQEDNDLFLSSPHDLTRDAPH